MNEVQVLLYTSYLHIIGGIETFVINYIDLMSKYYVVGVYCPKLPPDMLARISLKAPVYTNNEPISCDTLIMIRIMDEIPENVTYNKSIRMCHATKSNPAWFIRDDCDKLVHVSQVSKESFDTDGMVIHNPLIKNNKKALLLVSATRIPALDKGKNADRMLLLAHMLNRNNIPFMWFNFSDAPLRDAPKGFVNVGTHQDLQPFIKRADYLVQLSDQEGFGYSVAEALNNGTAVICTPFKTTKELGVIDGENGYIIPFNMNYDVRKLLNVPKFKYKYDNTEIVNQWRELIGKTKSVKKYIAPDMVKVIVKKTYRDVLIGREVRAGEIIRMTKDRAKQIMTVGDLIEVLEEV